MYSNNMSQFSVQTDIAARFPSYRGISLLESSLLLKTSTIKQLVSIAGHFAIIFSSSNVNFDCVCVFDAVSEQTTDGTLRATEDAIVYGTSPNRPTTLSPILIHWSQTPAAGIVFLQFIQHTAQCSLFRLMVVDAIGDVTVFIWQQSIERWSHALKFALPMPLGSDYFQIDSFAMACDFGLASSNSSSVTVAKQIPQILPDTVSVYGSNVLSKPISVAEPGPIFTAIARPVDVLAQMAAQHATAASDYLVDMFTPVLSSTTLKTLSMSEPAGCDLLKKPSLETHADCPIVVVVGVRALLFDGAFLCSWSLYSKDEPGRLLDRQLCYGKFEVRIDETVDVKSLLRWNVSKDSNSAALDNVCDIRFSHSLKLMRFQHFHPVKSTAIDDDTEEDYDNGVFLDTPFRMRVQNDTPCHSNCDDYESMRETQCVFLETAVDLFEFNFHRVQMHRLPQFLGIKISSIHILRHSLDRMFVAFRHDTGLLQISTTRTCASIVLQPYTSRSSQLRLVGAIDIRSSFYGAMDLSRDPISAVELVNVFQLLVLLTNRTLLVVFLDSKLESARILQTITPSREPLHLSCRFCWIGPSQLVLLDNDTSSATQSIRLLIAQPRHNFIIDDLLDGSDILTAKRGLSAPSAVALVAALSRPESSISVSKTQADGDLMRFLEKYLRYAPVGLIENDTSHGVVPDLSNHNVGQNPREMAQRAFHVFTPLNLTMWPLAHKLFSLYHHQQIKLSELVGTLSTVPSSILPQTSPHLPALSAMAQLSALSSWLPFTSALEMHPVKCDSVCANEVRQRAGSVQCNRNYLEGFDVDAGVSITKRWNSISISALDTLDRLSYQLNSLESAISLKCFSTCLNLPLPSSHSAPLYGDDGFRVPWTASQLSGLHSVVLFTQMRPLPLGQPLFEPPRQRLGTGNPAHVVITSPTSPIVITALHASSPLCLPYFEWVVRLYDLHFPSILPLLVSLLSNVVHVNTNNTVTVWSSFYSRPEVHGIFYTLNNLDSITNSLPYSGVGGGCVALSMLPSLPGLSVPTLTLNNSIIKPDKHDVVSHSSIVLPFYFIPDSQSVGALAQLALVVLDSGPIYGARIECDDNKIDTDSRIEARVWLWLAARRPDTAMDLRLSTGGPRQEFLALELIHMVRSSTEDAIYDRSVLMELFTTLACHLLSTPPQSPEHVDLRKQMLSSDRFRDAAPLHFSPSQFVRSLQNHLADNNYFKCTCSGTTHGPIPNDTEALATNGKTRRRSVSASPFSLRSSSSLLALDTHLAEIASPLAPVDIARTTPQCRCWEGGCAPILAHFCRLSFGEPRGPVI